MEDEWTEISFDSQTGWVDNDYISASMHPWNNVKLRDSKSLTSVSYTHLDVSKRQVQ